MVNIGRSGMWRPAVLPFLERIAAAVARQGKSTHSVTVEVGGVRVLLTPLEQQLALSAVDDTGEWYTRKHILVRDCLGLRVKIASGLARLDRVDASDTEDILAVLATDADLGYELMHELTLELKDISSAGSLNEAKELSHYRKQLLQMVERAERRTQPTAAGDDRGHPGGGHQGGLQPGVPARPTVPASAPVRPPARRRSHWLVWLAVGLVVAAGAIASVVVLMTR